VLEYVNLDKDARLFKHLKAKLEEATRAVRERNTQVADGFVAMGEDLKRDFAEADRTLRVLQCLVEGHNLLLQNLLRDQPTQSADINLVKLVRRDNTQRHATASFLADLSFLFPISSSSVHLLLILLILRLLKYIYIYI
jgi:type II secretory pathway predicted ATPase ExeA